MEEFKLQNKSEARTKSSMSIYIAEDEVFVFKRYATYGIVTLLSNIGGLLGLFLGVSVLSVVEVFYFFVIRFINNMWWKESN
jgi:Amiloride-sensitive sodium channel